jgi:hypothetical protein
MPMRLKGTMVEYFQRFELGMLKGQCSGSLGIFDPSQTVEPDFKTCILISSFSEAPQIWPKKCLIYKTNFSRKTNRTGKLFSQKCWAVFHQ